MSNVVAFPRRAPVSSRPALNRFGPMVLKGAVCGTFFGQIIFWLIVWGSR